MKAASIALLLTLVASSRLRKKDPQDVVNLLAQHKSLNTDQSGHRIVLKLDKKDLALIKDVDFQFKAVNTVANSKIGEVGRIRVLKPDGTCLTCSRPQACSTVNRPTKMMWNVDNVCNSSTSKFQWAPVRGEYDKTPDVEIKLPVALLQTSDGGFEEMSVEIDSVVPTDGSEFTPEDQARQVAVWNAFVSAGPSWGSLRVSMNGAQMGKVTGSFKLQMIADVDKDRMVD